MRCRLFDDGAGCGVIVAGPGGVGRPRLAGVDVAIGEGCPNAFIGQVQVGMANLYLTG